ncbi:MAG: hypothetical protein KA152_09325 [Verrucomicrobiales bacterium]|nr:hypothetical protein [Verrucomicrobiales bacterium]
MSQPLQKAFQISRDDSPIEKAAVFSGTVLHLESDSISEFGINLYLLSFIDEHSDTALVP